jgi:hypothetical protein
MKKLFLLLTLAAAAEAQMNLSPTTYLFASGLNDCTISGTYSGGLSNHYFDATLNSTGTPDKLQLYLDGATVGSPTNITGSFQAIGLGIGISCSATTGHTLNATWSADIAARGSSNNISSYNRGVGASSRSQQLRNNDWVSALDFSGVDPTGVSDSCNGTNVGLQAAITYVLRHGKNLFIPAGYYKCNTINFAGTSDILSFNSVTNPDATGAAFRPGGLTISGESRGNTIIFTTTSAANLLTARSTVAAFPTYNIEHISLIGPDTNTTIAARGSGVSGNGLVIAGTATPSVNLNDVLVQKFYGGIGMDLENIENFSFNFIRSAFNNTGFYMSSLFAGAINMLDADLNKTYGWNTSGMTEVVINAPVIQGTYGAGVNFTNMVDNTITGLHLEANNSSMAAAADLILGPLAHANTFINTGQYGGNDTILLNGGGTGASAVTGNHFINGNHDAFGGSGPPYGIKLANATSVGNTFYGWTPAEFDTSAQNVKSETFINEYEYAHQGTGAYFPALEVGTIVVDNPTNPTVNLSNGATNLDMSLGNVFFTNNSGSTTISTTSNGVNGQVVYLFVTDNNTFFGTGVGTGRIIVPQFFPNPMHLNAQGIYAIVYDTNTGYASVNPLNYQTGVTPGSYGSATHTSEFTVDQMGHLSAAGTDPQALAKSGSSTNAAATGITVSCTIITLGTPTSCTVTDPQHSHVQN